MTESIIKKPTSKLEIITPEIAGKWLSKNENNRHITKNSIEIYTSAMLRGEWVPNTQAIGFDVDGNLIDGQHRLYAVSCFWNYYRNICGAKFT